jgi:hypothetical protein
VEDSHTICRLGAAICTVRRAAVSCRKVLGEKARLALVGIRSCFDMFSAQLLGLSSVTPRYGASI